MMGNQIDEAQGGVTWNVDISEQAVTKAINAGGCNPDMGPDFSQDDAAHMAMMLRTLRQRLTLSETYANFQTQNALNKDAQIGDLKARLVGITSLVRAMIEVDGGMGSKYYHAGKYYDARQTVLDVLKQSSYAPQAETCKRCGGDGREVDYETGQSMTCPCTWQNQKPRPWTRNDGTTTPERGDVVDRRKSAGGGEWDWSIQGRRNSGEYGRRKDDCARWTVQETSQTTVLFTPVREAVYQEFWAKQGRMSNSPITLADFLTLADLLDRRSAVK